MDGSVNGKRMIRGAQYFALLSLAGLALLFVVPGADTLGALQHVHGGFVLLSCFVALLDLILSAGRYHIFVRRIRPGSPFSLSIRAELANRFVGAVTPSQTGGGAGQLLILFKGGIPIPDAVSFLAINFLSTVVFFLAAGGGAAYLFRGHFSGGTLALLIRYAFVAFAVMGAFVFLALWRPDLIARAARALLTRRGVGRTGMSGFAHRVGTWVIDNVEQYRATVVRFTREAPSLVVTSVILTVVLYVTRFTLAYFVLLGLGVHAPYLEVLAMQALLQFILYVAPTPGGSGIAELATAAVMARFAGPAPLAVFTAVLRLFLIYLPSAAGCAVLIAALRPVADVAAPQAVPLAGAGLEPT